MSEITFANAGGVHLIWIAALFLILWSRSQIDRNASLAEWINPRLQGALVSRTPRKARVIQFCFLAAMLVFGIIALMRPQSPGEAQVVSTGKKSADIMVVLDLSKSMLAEDAAPSITTVRPSKSH